MKIEENEEKIKCSLSSKRFFPGIKWITLIQSKPVRKEQVLFEKEFLFWKRNFIFEKVTTDNFQNKNFHLKKEKIYSPWQYLAEVTKPCWKHFFCGVYKISVFWKENKKEKIFQYEILLFQSWKKKQEKGVYTLHHFVSFQHLSTTSKKW